MRLPSVRLLSSFALAAVAAALGGCASPEPPAPTLRPADIRARVATLLPPRTADSAAWAADIQAAFSALELQPTVEAICAVVAVTEQESSFRADPPVPGLPAIAWRQIEQRAERAGVPMLLVRAALQVDSPDGRSYGDRIDRARTERDLSETFDDFIGMVPLGRKLFGGYNPVATAGPMQVSIRFAEQQAARKPYPYPVKRSLRDEVFTRRGGLYFGIAHLLDYPADYPQPLYRFADFNAGHHASRNAALQNAISVASGIPLALDGDLVAHGADDDAVGATEAAARTLAARLDLSHAAVRRDLERGTGPDLARTDLYERVFALADRVEGRALPRAMLPGIQLRSPKITRSLTTAWFAQRVDERHRRCVSRGRSGAG